MCSISEYAWVVFGCWFHSIEPLQFPQQNPSDPLYNDLPWFSKHSQVSSIASNEKNILRSCNPFQSLFLKLDHKFQKNPLVGGQPDRQRCPCISLQRHLNDVDKSSFLSKSSSKSIQRAP